MSNFPSSNHRWTHDTYLLFERNRRVLTAPIFCILNYDMTVPFKIEANSYKTHESQHEINVTFCFSFYSDKKIDVSHGYLKNCTAHLDDTTDSALKIIDSFILHEIT